MHAECYKLFEGFATGNVSSGMRVLDVGSCDVNGTLRPVLKRAGALYAGCDMSPGPNVDIVQGGPYELPGIDGEYDVVVSANCLEHCKRPWLLLLEMDRVLRAGGMLAISVPFHLGVHAFPIDCWRILPDAFADLLGDLMVESGRRPYEIIENRVDVIDTWVVARKSL